MKIEGYKDFEDERYDRLLLDRVARRQLEGYEVLGKAEDGFMVRVGDYEQYGCWLDHGARPDGFAPREFSKTMGDQGGSQMHIYIEDGEVRMI